MQKRTRTLLLIAVALLVAVAVAVFLRLKTPPDVARLLPECDAIVYFDLAPVRAATHFDRHPPKPSPAYQQFIDATGIVAERDLDRVAFALNRMPDPSGLNGPVSFTEVLSGRFDERRLATYLSSQSKGQESYRDRTIYLIPSPQGYTDRVTILNDHTIAASNAPTPEQLHAILEHSRGFLAAQDPSLLSARYGDVPALAPAWAIGKLGLPLAENGKLTVAGLELPIPADAEFVASLRFSDALHLEVQELAGSEAAAGQSAQALTGLLGLMRKLEQTQPTAPALNEFLNSITIVPEKDRAVLRATVPADLVKKIAQNTP
jgi:hypothetical protein